MRRDYWQTHMLCRETERKFWTRFGHGSYITSMDRLLVVLLFSDFSCRYEFYERVKYAALVATRLKRLFSNHNLIIAQHAAKLSGQMICVIICFLRQLHKDMHLLNRYEYLKCFERIECEGEEDLNWNTLPQQGAVK